MAKYTLMLSILGSIALHLLAFVTLNLPKKSTANSTLTYVEAISISKTSARTISHQSQKPVASSQYSKESTRDASVSEKSAALLRLRETIARALDENLAGLKSANRNQVSELVVQLEFFEDGRLKQKALSRSSGEASLDSQVLEALSRTSLDPSPELSNLKVQIPVRLF